MFLSYSLGIRSVKKSKVSVEKMLEARSDRCRVRRLAYSVNAQERCTNSIMNSSQAFANSTGVYDDIIRTSSSLFIIFLTLASGRWWFLNRSGSFGIRSI
jgi:hypothetical protein